MDIAKLQDFGRAKVREDALSADLKRVKQRREKLEPDVQEMLAAAGVPRMTVKVVDDDDAVAALRAAAAALDYLADDHHDLALAAQLRDLADARSVAGDVTVYVERKLWAGATKVDDGEGNEVADWDTAAPALVAAGLGDYVKETANVQSLSAHFREVERQRIEELKADGVDDPIVDPEDLIPPALRGVITLTERYTAKAIKG